MRARHRIASPALVAGIVGLVAAVSCLVPGGAHARDDRRAGATPRPVVPRGPLSADEQATIALFERSRDAVVYISTSRRVRDVWTRDVFSVPRGTGSGFFWDDAGHVVTNYHVIEGASEATLRLADGQTYDASLVGASPAHDIAVLRIGAGHRKAAPLPLGTSADLKVGQKVYAIGNPFGLDRTLTTGIISALDRSLPGESGITIERLIQTDAAINPGNSGGPLLDSAGRLIGINTAIYSPSGASAGIGFAVPVDTINRVVPQLIRDGRYVRPSIGVVVDDDLNQRLSRLLGVEGVIVLRVDKGPAAAAGLQGAVVTREGRVQPRDVIVAVDGRPVASVGHFLGLLDERQVGEVVQLDVLRDGRRRRVGVRLEAGGA
ncbi:MAG: S1C family serine protease [Lautropia sp.]